MAFDVLKKIKYKHFNLIILVAISLFFSLVISLLLSYLNTPKIPVFGFHGIVDLEQPDSTTVKNQMQHRMDYSKQELSIFLDYLVQNNYWFLSTQELYDYFLEKSKLIPPEHIGQRPVMISFDDSYKGNFVNVTPILEELEQKYHRKATMVTFVNPGTLAKPNRPSTSYLSCEDLRTGFSQGFYDIQSHGLNHKKLTEISSEEVVEELAQAQVELRQCIGDLDTTLSTAKHFAYPNGATNRRVIEQVEKYYLSAYLYDSKPFRFCWLKNHYLISRFTVNQEKSAQGLIHMVKRVSPIKSDQLCD